MTIYQLFKSLYTLIPQKWVVLLPILPLMKMGSHKAINGSLSVFLGFDIAGIALTVLGGILPDLLDRIIAGNNEWTFLRVHRTITHWWLLWAVILFLCYSQVFPVIFQINTSEIIWYLSFGSLLHIAFDSFTKSGVPFLNPFKQSIGFHLFLVGSAAEYALVAILSATFLYFGVGR